MAQLVERACRGFVLAAVARVQARVPFAACLSPSLSHPVSCHTCTTNKADKRPKNKSIKKVSVGLPNEFYIQYNKNCIPSPVILMLPSTDMTDQVE